MTHEGPRDRGNRPEHPEPRMHERHIELKDGRYMIFFTFDLEAAEKASDSQATTTKTDV